MIEELKTNIERLKILRKEFEEVSDFIETFDGELYRMIIMKDIREHQDKMIEISKKIV